MKCDQVEYFRLDDEYYVALSRESCINFILQGNDDLYYSEIDSILEKVSPDTLIYSYIIESTEYKGLTCSVNFDVVTLQEIYENLFDKDSDLPLQIVFDL